MANFKYNSRYGTAVVTSNRAGKNFIILRSALDLTPNSGDTFFTVTQEVLRRPDIIAQTFYGNTDLWWVIYEFNSIKDPFFELKLGQILRIPALERVLVAISALGE